MEGKRYISVILPLRIGWEPYYYIENDNDNVDIGDRLQVMFAGRSYAAVVSGVDVLPAVETEKIRPVQRRAAGLQPVRPSELELWRAVADYYLCTLGEVFKAAYPARKTDSEAMQERRTARLHERLAKKREQAAKARSERTREKYLNEIEAIKAQLGGTPARSSSVSRPVELSEAQTAACSGIREAFRAGKTALLKGVAGAGKTEIYLKLAEEALAEGKNVLYLVPEIALSRQTEDRLRTHFPHILMTFHSRQTALQRTEVTEAVRGKGPYLVLGTRSALFLPHHDLGLIVVDEEHDTSYKQDSAPRYHARETAIMLGRILRCPVLLGSATPSIESLYNAEIGRFAEIDLPERYFASEEAEVQLIDTIAEKRKNGMVGSFSRKLIEAVRETLERRGQTVILRARRAYAPLVQCTGCGCIPHCPRCNVSLSLHKGVTADRLVCHYCGHSEPFTGQCPRCGSETVPLGAGTQRIEEEALTLFPEATVARLDSDTPPGAEAEIIRRFAAGKIDLLIGTQIVAKGFDFSGLSLVAVMQADSLLGLQDFRADEKALQLLEQFRGRSGRRGAKGKLLIQTAQPGHPVYRELLQRSAGFFRSLLAERKQFGYPPYTRLVNIILKDSNLQRIETLSRALAERFPVPAVGPYSPVTDRVSGMYIRHIRLMLARDRSLIDNKKKIAEAISSFERTHNWPGHIFIDVDPV